MNLPAILAFAAAVCLSIPAEVTAQQFQQDTYYPSLVRWQTTRGWKLRSAAAVAAAVSKTRSTPRINSRFGNPAATLNDVVTRNDEQLSRAIVELALAVGRSSASGNSPAEVFSPVSIVGVLEMLLLGADGTTRSELLGALKMSDKTKMSDFHRRAAGMMKNLLDGSPKESERLAWRAETCGAIDDDDDEDDPATNAGPKELRIANAIFAQHNLPISPTFVGLSNQLYGASAHKVNFHDSRAASDIMNKWVAQATNGKIREIANGQLPVTTNMVIASSLYFKASWQTEFMARATKPRNFYPNGAASGQPIQVDMMTLTTCLPYHFEKALGLRMLGLPYSDNSTTMYVLMPQNSTRAKLRSLQGQLSATRLDTMIAKMKRRTATVGFPRMHLTSSTNLEKTFRQLGVKSIFNPQHSDLHLMLDPAVASQNDSGLFVSQINHKVDLSVDERGTEGAAVTVTLVDRIASSVVFNVNEPFLIYVRHDPTTLPIFYGAVFDPRG